MFVSVHWPEVVVFEFAPSVWLAVDVIGGLLGAGVDDVVCVGCCLEDAGVDDVVCVGCCLEDAGVDDVVGFGCCLEDPDGLLDGEPLDGGAGGGEPLDGGLPGSGVLGGGVSGGEESGLSKR